MEERFVIEPIGFDARQAAQYLNISLRKLDELCAGGELRPVRIGRKRIFPRTQLDSLMRRAATERIG